MSYTIVRDEAAEIDRLSMNMDNITRRRCKIGKVRMKPTRADWLWPPVSLPWPTRQPKDTFFVPPYEPIATWREVNEAVKPSR